MALDNLELCLQHVLQELALDDTSMPKRLSDVGIRSFADLINMKDKLESKEMNIPKPRRDELLGVLEWHRAQEEKRGKALDIVEDFSYDGFDKFRKEPQQSQDDRTAKDTLLNMLLTHPESQSQEVFNYLGLTPSDLSKHKRVQNLMGDLLHLCNFDFENFTADSIEAVEKKNNQIFLVNGPTQCGKSYIKSNVQCTGYVCGVPVVILTRGCSESFNLTEKLQGHLLGTPIEGKILNSKQVRRNVRENKNQEKKLAKSSKRKLDQFQQANEVIEKDGGSAVLANTPSQMNMIADLIEKERDRNPDYEFILIVDECDDMIRTDDGKQKTEQAYSRLRDLGPAFTVMISATLTPLLLHEKWKDQERLSRMKPYRIFPGDDYVGVEKLKPLKINGEEQYLQSKELKYSCGYTYKLPGMAEDYIPFTNNAVMKMYHDAARHGGLLLDVTSPRVREDISGNVFEKAEKTRAVLFHEKGVDIGCIVFVGKGIYLKYPKRKGDDPEVQGDRTANRKYLLGTKVEKVFDNGSTIEGEVASNEDTGYIVQFANGREEQMERAEIDKILCDEWVYFKPSEWTVGDLIGHLFEYFNCGIFVWGFTLMQRGQSFRGDDIVPTHIVHQYGDGFSLAKVMQSLGRATFKGKNILKKNGFKQVTVLTRRDDLDATISNYKYMEEIIPEDSNETLVDTMDGVPRKLSSESNYASFTSRKLGESKRARQRYNHDAFVKSENLLPNEEKAKEILSNDDVAQAMLRALDNLFSNANAVRRFDDKSIIEAYNDQFRGVRYLSQGKGQKLIREFVRINILEKGYGESNEAFYWCPNPQKLRLFVAEAVYVPKVKVEPVSDEDIFANSQTSQKQNGTDNFQEL